MQISFWLLPSSKYFEILEKIIHTLSQKYKAPKFEPHLTVFSGKKVPHKELDVFEKVFKDVGPIHLKVRNITYGKELTKTLFMEFYENEKVTRLNKKLEEELGAPFLLHPHLSLMYKKMDASGITSSIKLPWKFIKYDRFQVISHRKIETEKDIGTWKKLYTNFL